MSTPLRLLQWAIGALILTLLAVPSAHATGPQPQCPEGTSLLAKFEWSGGGYAFEKPSGNDALVRVQGTPREATWTSTVDIRAIVLKGSTDDETLTPESPRAGRFTNASLWTRSGRNAGISNVQFCGSPPPPDFECVECGFGANDGEKLSEITLRYLGTEPATVQVYRSNRVKPGNLLFSEEVAPGTTFIVSAAAIGERDLGPKIGLYIGGEEVAEIHTSCSAPVTQGLTEASQPKAKDPNGVEEFEIRGGLDKQGRRLCGFDVCPDEAPPVIHFEWVYDLDPDDPSVGHGVIVSVSDDTEIGDVSFVYDTDNLRLIASDVGTTESVYTFQVLNLIEDSFIQVHAADACGTVTCPGDTDPPELTPYPQHGGIQEGMFSDATGIVTFDPFFLVNATATSTFDPLLTPQATVDFRIQQTDPDEDARFGILAADFCNAFILDPVISASKARRRGSAAGVIAASVPPAEFVTSGTPSNYALRPNQPNPFQSSTEIAFDLPEATPVHLAVYDVLGREVLVLADSDYPAGTHRVTLDATRLPAGTYLYRLLTPERQLAGTMVRAE